jgi:lysozyme
VAINSLEDQLVRDEGERFSAYPDSLGFLTIGVGICVDARRGCGLTLAESRFLLDSRIQRAKSFVRSNLPWTLGLDDIRREALENMAYQLEGHLLEFKHFLAALESNDYQTAANEMLDSKWAQHDSPARANRLAQQIRTGVRQ